MELQLGLALPIHSPPIITKRTLDLLNHCGSNECELAKRNKRCLEETYEKIIGDDDDHHFAAHLLVWDNDDDDDNGKGHKRNNSCPINDIDSAEENYIIGWPPIKSSRRNVLLQHQGRAGHGRGHRRVEIRKRSTVKIKVNAPLSSSSSSSSTTNNSMYVKVKMEGFGIARKVDLSLHRSYHTLKHALISMFSNYDQECIKDSESYTLTYQDKEGDWLLAGDVPWKSFIKSVQRLEILQRNK